MAGSVSGWMSVMSSWAQRTVRWHTFPKLLWRSHFWLVHRCRAKAIPDCLTLFKCLEKILELFKFAEKLTISFWQPSFAASELESNLVFNRARQYLLLIIQLIYSAVGGSFPITQPLGWERTFTVTGYVTIERLFRKKCHNTCIQAFWLWALCPQGSPGVDQILFKDRPLHHLNNQHPAAVFLLNNNYKCPEKGALTEALHALAVHVLILDLVGGSESGVNLSLTLSMVSKFSQLEI